MIYPACSGALTIGEIDSGFAHGADWLDQVAFPREAGGQPRPAPQGDMITARIGFVITTGDTAAEAQARSTAAYRPLNVQVTPAWTAPAVRRPALRPSPAAGRGPASGPGACFTA